MKTYTLQTENGQRVGFEISNRFLSSGAIADFIKQVPGCKVQWVRKMFSPSEVHVKFVYDGAEFEVWEPFGDNSRLHICPSDKADNEVIQNLEKAVSETEK